MRISKKLKLNYELCIKYLKQADLADLETACRSLSMFGYILNFYNDAKRFSEYCESIGEHEIAKYAVRNWNK